MLIETHNGTFTITNITTGEHRTFRIATQPDDAKFAPGKRILSILTGPDNTENSRDYLAIAFVYERGKVMMFKKYANTDYHILAAMLLQITGDTTSKTFSVDNYKIDAATTCRRCNRALTTPESISAGIGPICEGRTANKKDNEQHIELRSEQRHEQINEQRNEINDDEPHF